MENRVEIVPGMTVYGSDNEKLGSIVEVGSSHIVVEKGFFFHTDYYIPVDVINGAREDRVYLTVTKDEAANQNWGEQPTDWNTGVYDDTAYDATGTATAGDAYVGETAGETANIDRRTTRDNAVRVPVYEEDLQAVTRDVERGAVRIEKELVTEERTISVPVTEERVRVTRVEASDPTAVGDDAFREGVIEVPVRGQEVEVEKTARKTGEVVIEKEAETRTESVGGTVRREEVRVDDEEVTRG